MQLQHQKEKIKKTKKTKKNKKTKQNKNSPKGVKATKEEIATIQRTLFILQYSWVQYGNCQTQRLNALENIWFLHAPSI